MVGYSCRNYKRNRRIWVCSLQVSLGGFNALFKIGKRSLKGHKLLGENMNEYAKILDLCKKKNLNNRLFCMNSHNVICEKTQDNGA